MLSNITAAAVGVCRAVRLAMRVNTATNAQSSPKAFVELVVSGVRIFGRATAAAGRQMAKSESVYGRARERGGYERRIPPLPCSTLPLVVVR